MPQRHATASTAWEFCATVDETRQLVRFVAQRVGVEMQMTSVRVDLEHPHSPCAQHLSPKEGANIDGYIVRISCDASREAAALLREEIESTIQACVCMRR